MKEDYIDYNYDTVDNNDVVENRRNSKNYQTQKRSISFEVPLVDMLSKEDIKKLRMIE